MNSSMFVSIIILALMLANSYAQITNCSFNIGDTLYDLSQIPTTQDFSAAIDNMSIKFQLCSNVQAKCGTQQSYANLFMSTSTGTGCVHLTNYSNTTNITYSMINQGNPQQGLEILYQGGDTLNSSIAFFNQSQNGTYLNTSNALTLNNTYTFRLYLACNSSTSSLQINSADYEYNTNIFTVQAQTAQACPIATLSVVSSFVDKYYIIFTIVGLAIGLLESFFGIKLLYSTLFLSGFASGFLITLLVFFTDAITPSSTESAKWGVIMFALAMGLVVGYVTLRTPPIGLFILGAILGFIISLILYNAFLYKIQSQALLYIILVLLCFVLGILGICFQDYLLMIATSICGSYLAIRSLSLTFGGFPSEFEMIQELQIQNYSTSIGWPFYVYMNVIIVLAILSLVWQCRIKKRMDAVLEKDGAYVGVKDFKQLA